MKTMKSNYLLIVFAAFFAITFFSCNSTSKKANVDNNKNANKNEIVDINEIKQNKDTAQQIVNQIDTINQTDTIVADLVLFKTFKELTKSDTFKRATYTEYDWSSINLGVTDESGCEVINQKENDFIVLAVWQLTVGIDTISFQKLMKTADYTIYAYSENGVSQTPVIEESGFFVFKRYKNGNWKTLNLKTINSTIGEQPSGRVLGIYSYKTENKTLYIHKKEDYTSAGETFQRAGRIEHKFVWSEIQEDFIYSSASDLPNPILIHGGGYTGTSECANYYYAQINTGYYNDDQLKNKDEIKFAIEYERANDKKRIDIDENIKNEVINNKDKKKKIWLKYKTERILECEAMGPSYETEVNIIEDYEILWQNPIVATFTGFEMEDFVWYEFTSRLGYKYYFNEIKNNKYSLENENGDGPNPKNIDKKFKIKCHSKLINNEFGGGKFEYIIIDSIELINN